MLYKCYIKRPEAHGYKCRQMSIITQLVFIDDEALYQAFDSTVLLDSNLQI